MADDTLSRLAGLESRVDQLEKDTGDDHKRLTTLELAMTKQLTEIAGDVKSLLRTGAERAAVDKEQDVRLASLEGTRSRLTGSWAVITMIGAVALLVVGAVIVRVVDRLADAPQGPRTERHHDERTELLGGQTEDHASVWPIR